MLVVVKFSHQGLMAGALLGRPFLSVVDAFI
jgi:hypothetical protein